MVGGSGGSFGCLFGVRFFRLWRVGVLLWLLSLFPLCVLCFVPLLRWSPVCPFRCLVVGFWSLLCVLLVVALLVCRSVGSLLSRALLCFVVVPPSACFFWWAVVCFVSVCVFCGVSVLGRCAVGACVLVCAVRGCVVLVCGFAGSRGLPSSTSGLVSSVVSAVLSSGASVAVGCCGGADQAVLSCLPSGAPVSVFAVGSASGAGFWSGSAPLSLLRRFPVRWLSGGPLSVPLRGRLARRSDALLSFVRASGGSLVVFVSSPPSVHSGSWRLVWSALFSGVPVVVFPVAGCPLPSFSGLFPVSWSVAGSGVWSSGFRPSV